MKRFKVFEVKDIGLCGRERIVGYALDQETAQHLAKGHGEWGNDGPVRETEIKIYESMGDVMEEERLNSLRQDEFFKATALQKLNREERVALGLEEV